MEILIIPWEIRSRNGKSMPDESSIRNFRDDCLNVNWFMSLEDAGDKIER
jgi:hypothetical protein